MMMPGCQTFTSPEQSNQDQNDQGELTELDAILQNIELENKPDTQLSEKEQQRITALERNIREKEVKIQRIQEELDHSDGDAKTLHRQFRQNKDNFESLKKDAEVLTSHGDTMETNLKQCQGKYESIREKRTTQLNQYQMTWANYHKKYESTQLAQRWKGCHGRVVVGLQELMTQAEGVKELTTAVEELQQKLKAANVVKGAWKTFIIELARVKVATSTFPREADEARVRIMDLDSQLATAQQRKKEAEECQKAAQLALEKIDAKEPVRDRPPQSTISPPTQSHQLPAPVSAAPVLQRPMPPQLFIPQTPRLDNQRVVEAPPTPQSFLQIPQRHRTSEVQVTIPSRGYTRNAPIPSNASQSIQPQPVVVTQQTTQPPPTPQQTRPPQNEEPSYERMQEVPMETEPSFEQLPLSTPAMPRTPATPRTPKTPTGEGVGSQEELSASQVREKILNLSKSPGFTYACRPMYQAGEMTSSASTKEDQPPPDSFLNFFGQMDRASPAPSSSSAMNMFASPVYIESSESNVMSMFGGPSQEDPGPAPQQEDQSSSLGFSFNFSSSSPTPAETGRSTFSLF